MRTAITLGLLIPLSFLPAQAQSPKPKAEEAAAALVRGNTAQAVAGYTGALADTTLPNDRRAVTLTDRGVAYMRLGQTKLAMEDLNAAVQLFPEYPAAYNNRGNLLISLGLHKEAIRDFDRAILLAPGYAAAYNNRAGAYLKTGQTAEAIRDYSNALKLLPSNAAPLSGRGRAYLAIKRPHAAIRDFTRAINSDSRFASAYRNRADAKIEVQQHDEAIEDLSRAIAFDANNADMYVARGNAYLASDDSDSAIRDFSRAIELQPASFEALAARGLSFGRAESYDEAFADLNRALELNPRSALAFAYRAYVYKLSGQIEVAQSDVATAAQIDPQLPEVLWARAELDDATGQKDAAIAGLRKALAQRPSLKVAAVALERLGASVIDEEDKPVAELGLDPWQVVQRGDLYYAVSSQYPRLRIPLETLGEGRPRLLEWEAKKAPHKGIGVLRFHGGVIPARSGPEEVELAAIIDLYENNVVAIQPHRQGAKVSNWTWQEGKVVVASADGVTDEHLVRTVVAREPTRRTVSRRSEWDSWGDPWGGGQQRRQRKPKTLFDLFFNN